MTFGSVTRARLPILAAVSVLIVAGALSGATKKAIDRQGPCADVTSPVQGPSKKAGVAIHTTDNNAGKSCAPRAVNKVARLHSSPRVECAPEGLQKTAAQPVKKAHMVRDRDFAALEATAPHKPATSCHGAQGGAR